MSATRACDQQGHIGGADAWYPDTDWDRDVGALHPRVACTHLRCDDCGASVRQLVGHELASGLHVRGPGAKGSGPLGSALKLVANPHSRAYGCDCTSSATARTESLLPAGDDWRGHELPWSCAGHPELTLPAEVDGVSLTASTDWAGLVAEALAGRLPAAWSPPGVLHARHPAAWLARIVAHLADRSLADQLSREVAPQLLSGDLAVRRAAINFYRHRPCAPGSEQLGDALTGHLSLFDGQQVAGARRDLAYELRDCLEVQLANSPTPALIDLVKAELLAGRGTTGFVLWTGGHDPDWIADHAATLVAKQVASAGRLRRVIASAPDAVQQKLEQALSVP